MNQEKIKKIIEENKEIQTDKIVNCIKKLINNYPDYYNNKLYSKKFIIEQKGIAKRDND